MLKTIKKQAKDSENKLLKYIRKMPEADIRALPTDELIELVFNYKDRMSFIEDKVNYE